MESLRQDLRFALRSLGRSPAFTIAAVICMALGIAANVFVYSPFNALLLRPMPYRDADRVMRVNTWRTEESRQNWSSWSWADYQDVRAASTDHFTATGLYRVGQWNVGNLAEPERVSGARVTSALLPMLGFQPALGRFFTDAEELEGRTAVLGHGLWQRKFGGDSSVVGRAVTINGLPHTVVGVMEEGVRFPETEDLWLPAEPTPDQRTNRDFHAWQFLGRLAPGLSLTQAEQGVQATMATLATRFPETNRTKSAWLLPTNDDLAAEVGPIFYTMVGAVAFVLLIACSNVANLLLARGSARQRELAVRLSMGATRRRLVVQLLTESVMLSVLGGVAGILLGTWGVDAFIRWGLPSEVPYYMHFDVDRTVLILATAITIVSGVIFGIVPALALTRPDLAVALREAGGRGGSAHAALGRWRSGLVVAQLSLSLVLLAGAALMVQSFLRSQNAKLGFATTNVLTGSVALVGERYPNDSVRSVARGELLRVLATVPGTRSVGMTAWLPIGECCMADAYHLPGSDAAPGDRPTATWNAVSPGFFAAVETPLLRGREFTAADRRDAPNVVVISQALAEREWAGRDPIGQSAYVGSDTVPRTIVGVVANLVVRKLTERTRLEQIYVPLDQGWTANAAFMVRLDGAPEGAVTAVKSAVASLDRDLPISRLFSMDRVIRDRMFEGRVYGAMFAVFGVVALLLASIGLYGVMSYGVAQRTQELGVRMALGAHVRDVLGLVLARGARLILLGVVIGVPAAFGLAQLLRGTLYGIRATDPFTFIMVPLVLGLVGLLASWVPARRATRVDPVEALRAE